MSVIPVEQQLADLAQAAQAAARALALATTEQKNAALAASAAELVAAKAEVQAANALDVAAAEAAGLTGALVKRLVLDDPRYAAMVRGVAEVAALPDPVGEVMEEWERPNGLRIRKLRVPLGVAGLIYESRPNVTVDAAILCLKTGNAVLLKGGKEAERSNAALAQVLRRGLAAAGLPADGVALVPGGREGAGALMRAVGLVDVLIPRGGAGLIRSVVENSRVPVLETGAGVCHVYVHREADLEMAARIAVNAKVSNPAVCNAAETLLVDAAVADAFLPRVGALLRAAGVTLRADAAARQRIPWAEPASAADWAEEYLDLILSVRVVDGMDTALEHIRLYGTKHSDAIITADAAAAERFMNTVDAAAVYWNASTRFTDGGEFGFGAEVGISTQKLHARGPMGLRELTSYKFRVIGNGQIR